MLVEDDKSLREIYGVRLLAEGYDIVSAGDGEEALAMAIKERPQLIISDVMMPKVSGYDMLDILRSTTETKNIRVIMMTALSSEEQRMRAESLGADRYLVKSQVGIEDVVRVVHEVLEDTPETMSAAASQPSQPPLPASPPAMTTAPQSAGVPAPKIADIPPAPMPAAPQPTVMPTPTIPTAPPAVSRPPLGSAPKPASLKDRIIQPLHDPAVAPVNINDLLDKELAKEAGLTDTERPVIETTDQEKADITETLQSFVPPEPTPVEAPVDTADVPTPAPAPSLLPTPGVTTIAPTTPISVNEPPVTTTPVMPVVPEAVQDATPTAAPFTPSVPPISTPVAPPPVSAPQPVPPITQPATSPTLTVPVTPPATQPVPPAAPLPEVPTVP